MSQRGFEVNPTAQRVTFRALAVLSIITGIAVTVAAHPDSIGGVIGCFVIFTLAGAANPLAWIISMIAGGIGESWEKDKNEWK